MRLGSGIASVLTFVLVASSAAGQDFDPAGRRHAPRPGGAPVGSHAPGPEPKSPPRDVLISRYTTLALAQPAAPFVLDRLIALYRERDGNVAKLVEQLLERTRTAGGAEPYAAGLVLAAVYQRDGRTAEARAAFERAVEERPKDPAPRLALAALEKDAGDLAAARARYEQALPLVLPADRDATLRALVAVLLDAKAWDEAKRRHRELVRLGAGSFFVKAELGRELYARGEYARAEGEMREVVEAASGDLRTLAPALEALGRTLAKEHKNDEALATLRRALALGSRDPGLVAGILGVIAEVYRTENDLGSLQALLEAEHPRDRQRLAQLGALYEETGDVDKALGAYRRALAAAGGDIDLRLKVIHLLQSQGELESATREYETLIRAAPHSPDYVFELCETLIQRGERPRALAMLGALEARAGRDEEVLGRLADFYERVDEKRKSVAVLARLTTVAPHDPTHLVDLGDRYYQRGDRRLALATWERIRSVVPSKAKALALLGEVYLEHDMALEALEALREAKELEPGNVAYRKSYAGALERGATVGGALTERRYDEARALWEELWKGAGADRALAREARTHLVTLYGLTRQLEVREAALRRRFAASPPDLEAGRLLADVQIRLHRLADAEAVLRRLTELAPGDAETWLTLERVLVQRRDLPAAITALEKLAQVDPKRARELYQRMAQYAAELYRDDDAIAYAARAVQLSPDDADGHAKLGAMYKKKQDVAHAVRELYAAIAKNDKLYPVYFELADLLLSQKEIDEADQLFRRVVRGAPDEELVSQAARRSMQINLGRGTLESLERDLLPVAIGNPRKPVYRKLLVELYGTMAFPLIQAVQGAPRAEADAARAKLVAIGARAVKPLLDALADERETQQRTALDLLAFVQNRSSGPALFAFATGQADQPLRVRAMIACGALRDPALLPKYEALLAPKQDEMLAPGDSLSVAAAWAVARLGDKRATPLLQRLLAKGAPEVRALAAIGLGLLSDKKSAGALARMAGSLDAGNVARAAAVMALGDLGAKDAEPMLVSIAKAADATPRKAAVLTLARLGAEAAPNVVADALLASDPSVREGGALGAVVLATGRYESPPEPLGVPDGPLDLREILEKLAPTGYTASDRARALVVLRPALERAAVAALETSEERARVVADALLAGHGRPAFAPLTDGIDALPAADRKQAEQAAESIAAALVPGLAMFVRHPAIDLRTRAVQFLAVRPEQAAQKAVVDALSDPDASVRQAALAAIGPGAAQPVLGAVAAQLSSGDAWALRVRAAEALGRVGRDAGPHVAALAAAARGDPYALVREASVRALVRVDPSGAAAVLRKAAAGDPEERVRSVARDLLSPGGSHETKGP